AALRVSGDDEDGEAVMALAAHGLNRRAAHPRVGRGKLEEAAHPCNIGIVARLFEDRTFPHDIVHDNEGAATRVPHRPLEIVWRAGLVGINEKEIEWRLLGEARQSIDGSAYTNFDHAGEPGAGNVGEGALGVARICLKRNEMPAGRKRPREPNRAVTAER